MNAQILFLIGSYEYQDENGEWESDRSQILAIPASEAARNELSCCLHDGGVWDGQCLIVNGNENESGMDLVKHVLSNMPSSLQSRSQISSRGGQVHSSSLVFVHGPIMRDTASYYIEKFGW